MRFNKLKAILKNAAFATTGLLLGVGMAAAQQTINLSAGPATATLPDGSAVPMWGYTCGALVTGSTATCAALNSSAGTGWSPVVITVPIGPEPYRQPDQQPVLHGGRGYEHHPHFADDRGTGGGRSRNAVQRSKSDPRRSLPSPGLPRARRDRLCLRRKVRVYSLSPQKLRRERRHH